MGEAAPLSKRLAILLRLHSVTNETSVVLMVIMYQFLLPRIIDFRAQLTGSSIRGVSSAGTGAGAVTLSGVD